MHPASMPGCATACSLTEDRWRGVVHGGSWQSSAPQLFGLRLGYPVITERVHITSGRLDLLASCEQQLKHGHGHGVELQLGLVEDAFAGGQQHCFYVIGAIA